MAIADDMARTILEGFDRHFALVCRISAGAKERFEQADWAAVREASRQRLDIFQQRVLETVEQLRARFPEAGDADHLWRDIKRAYIPLLYEHRQPEYAETFFNSVACRVLNRAYYRNEYIFWRPTISTEFLEGERPCYRTYQPSPFGLRGALRKILRDFALRVPFADLDRDVAGLVRALKVLRRRGRVRHPNFQLQVLSSLFYRNKGAYVVGRIVNGTREQPFAVALRHAPQGGLYADALLLEPADLSALFSLAHAYFMVDMEVPAAFVRFLRALMPQKPAAELYTAMGMQKQGKTVFYRELFWHLAHSNDRFCIAPGARGMVMMVFTLPSFPYVFKVIRDRFAPPKETTRLEVMQKYRMVKLHDRVGRMADTLEYSEVALPVGRFEPALLEELDRTCAASLLRDGERLVIQHLYIERRLTPLDVYLRGADAARAEAAIEDFGRAIEEMANANIFPGDLLLKNFGLTRFGRVVFYDYDEVGLLTEVKFRALPAARSDEEELAGEPWFAVGSHDVFPQELATFLFPAGPLRERFLALHGELLDPAWWTARQAEVRAGLQRDLIPYPESARLRSKEEA